MALREAHIFGIGLVPSTPEALPVNRSSSKAIDRGLPPPGETAVEATSLGTPPALTTSQAGLLDWSSSQTGSKHAAAYHRASTASLLLALAALVASMLETLTTPAASCLNCSRVAARNKVSLPRWHAGLHQACLLQVLSEPMACWSA